MSTRAQAVTPWKATSGVPEGEMHVASAALAKWKRATALRLLSVGNTHHHLSPGLLSSSGAPEGAESLRLRAGGPPGLGELKFSSVAQRGKMFASLLCAASGGETPRNLWKPKKPAWCSDSGQPQPGGSKPQSG